MRIFAFDPGSSATGLACLKDYGQPVLSELDLDWWQYTDEVELYNEFMKLKPTANAVVLVEDYSHGGAFTLEAKRTLEVVGFLVRQATRDGLRVERRHKDKRLSSQSEAARLLGDTVANLKKDPARKDAFSALAHTIAYKREQDSVRNSGA
jgi:hypothetical protein